MDKTQNKQFVLNFTLPMELCVGSTESDTENLGEQTIKKHVLMSSINHSKAADM